MIKVTSWTRIAVAVLALVSLGLLGTVVKQNGVIAYTQGYYSGISQCG